MSHYADFPNQFPPEPAPADRTPRKKWEIRQDQFKSVKPAKIGPFLELGHHAAETLGYIASKIEEEKRAHSSKPGKPPQPVAAPEKRAAAGAHSSALGKTGGAK